MAHISGSTIPELWQECVQKYADRIALSYSPYDFTHTYSYRELDLWTRQVAQTLTQQNTSKNLSSCIVIAAHSPAWVAVWLSCLRLGITCVPLPIDVSTSLLESCCTQLKNPCIIAQSTTSLPEKILNTQQVLNMSIFEFRKEEKTAFNFPQVSAQTVAEILFTSGSTSQPKGVVLTHSNISHAAREFATFFDDQPAHRVLSLLPPSHIYEQVVGLLTPLLNGAQIHISHTKIPSGIAQICAKFQPTALAVVPGILQSVSTKAHTKLHSWGVSLTTVLKVASYLPKSVSRMLLAPLISVFGSHLQILAVGGAPADPKVMQLWRLAGVEVLNGFGCTETAGPCVVNTPGSEHPDSLGRALPGVETRVVAGELWLKGPQVAKKYFNAAKPLQQDGWYKTGDYVSQTDGYFFFSGRNSNMWVLPNGKNVFPEDIESQLLADSRVLECVCLLIESENAPPRIHACIVCTDPSQLDSISAAANKHLSSYQQIASSSHHTELPKTKTLKIDRKKSQQLIQSSTETQSSQSAPLSKMGSLLALITSTPITSDKQTLRELSFDSLRLFALVSLLEEQYAVDLSETTFDLGMSVVDLEKCVSKAPKQKMLGTWQYRFPCVQLRSLVHYCIYAYLRLFHSLTVSPTKAIASPAVIIFNHSSHLDAPVVLSSFSHKRIAVLMAQDYFFTSTLSSFLCRLIMSGIPVNRAGVNKKVLLEIGSALSNGYSIALAPEGTRSITGTVNTFQQGAAFIAHQFQLPIIPVCISGAFEALPKGRSFPTHSKIHSQHLATIPFDPARSIEETTKLLEDLYKKATLQEIS